MPEVSGVVAFGDVRFRHLEPRGAGVAVDAALALGLADEPSAAVVPRGRALPWRTETADDPASVTRIDDDALVVIDSIRTPSRIRGRSDRDTTTGRGSATAEAVATSKP